MTTPAGTDSCVTACPFCHPAPERIVFENPLVIALWDAFPVNRGHALIVPRRHVPTWFDASAEERVALMAAVDEARDLIVARFAPDGFNIGINVGQAAGQTVFHLHVHLIPRFDGDVPDPRGGVRWVIPARGNYLAPSPDRCRLISGGADDPLLHCLSEEFTRADQVDIAVGFVMQSGIRRIETHLRDFLGRGGRLRLLTGDYLGVTDPDALVRLLDLEGDRQLRVFETASSNRAAGTPTAPPNATPNPAHGSTPNANASPSTSPIAFHPKAYVFMRAGGDGVAFVGSSNLSESALLTGIEWSYRTVSSTDAPAFAGITQVFESLFHHPSTRELTAAWVDGYRQRRKIAPRPETAPPPIDVEIEPQTLVTPHAVQLEALAALEKTRAAGNTAGLVVLATGLGKTWLSAFDSNRPEYRRILFVAHREEILRQSRDTYRIIRPEARLGFYQGPERDPDAEVLFASIQTLGRTAHLERFGRDAFDYIVVDEFHHAAAPTYRRLIDWFRPRFLLGLTATPERTDGGDLLALCQENLAYRCDLVEGVRRDLLCRFDYYGVPDEVDYRSIPWRNARFDEQELTRHVATQTRARNAYEQLSKHSGPASRTLAFCVSQLHADFMAEFFRGQGLRAVAVHSGATSAPRARSLEELAAGRLDVICAVDIFNEGLDLPSLDTILMLRPTESSILWLQQFGRGLRKTDDDKRLTVIDYIGNHRTFLLKPRTLFGLPPGDQVILDLLARARGGRIEIAPGCFVTYELETIDILGGLVRPPTTDALRRYYEDFVELHGLRPRAIEAFHDGYTPRAMRPRHGSWLGFIAAMRGLGEEQSRAFERHRGFLEALEATPMTRSYKMLVLQAMLNEDRFPGEIGIAQLGEAVAHLASRNHLLRDDLGPGAGQTDGLRRLLEENPIAAWVGGSGTGGTPYFAYEGGVFRSTLPTEPAERAAFQELTREIVDWRLADYLQRLGRQPDSEVGFVCKVSHSGGKPILRLPDRESHPDLPTGPTPLEIDGTTFDADFVKVALNVVRQPGNAQNQLPGILRGWFGPEAGLPGTRHEVRLEKTEAGWRMKPLGRREGQLQLWRRYSREEIPKLFGFPFSVAVWNVGFVASFPGHVFLLVTVDKSGKGTDFQYLDRFLSPDVFEWKSQNRTTKASSHGQLIRDHKGRGVAVHLFVRKSGKIPGGGAAPFLYCGDVVYVDWDGEKPITVRWRLPEAAPERLRAELGIG